MHPQILGVTHVSACLQQAAMNTLQNFQGMIRIDCTDRPTVIMADYQAYCPIGAPRYKGSSLAVR